MFKTARARACRMERTEAESKAQASLILGIVGLFVAQLILGILAIVFANKARDLAAAAGMPEPKDARTGRILGIIDLCVVAVVVVAAAIAFVVARRLSGSSP